MAKHEKDAGRRDDDGEKWDEIKDEHDQGKGGSRSMPGSVGRDEVNIFSCIFSIRCREVLPKKHYECRSDFGPTFVTPPELSVIVIKGETEEDCGVLRRQVQGFWAK